MANHRMNLHNPNVWQLSLQLITSVIDTFDYKVGVFVFVFCFLFLFWFFCCFLFFFCSCCFYTEKKDVYRIARQRDIVVKNIQHLRVMKDANGSGLVEEAKVL